MPKVVFLCKGTRGDVHPMLAIALAYKKAHHTDEVFVVCTVSSIAGFNECLLDEGLKVICCLPETNVDSQQRMHSLTSDSKRLQLLKLEADICFQTCIGSQLIVFNLFSLEGYFIAQHLQVPCIAASPHLITSLARSPPAGFESQLFHTLPELYAQLKSTELGDDVVSYAEVDHWMWRLFLDDYGSVCDHLHLLSNVPFSSSFLPPPTTLLYGVSSILTQRQPYWPRSVHLCGYWLPPPVLQRAPDSKLITLVDSVTRPLVYIGFGSMETYIVDVEWAAVLNMFESALKLANMDGIFQCKENGLVQQTFEELSTAPQNLKLWTGEAPHDWLFPKCVATLHHGGSGTVATSLLAKRLQLICPVMFDQEHWAEVLAWKSLGVHLSPLKVLAAEELCKCLKLVSCADITKSIEMVHAELVKEDGIKTALIEIEKVLGNQNAL